MNEYDEYESHIMTGFIKLIAYLFRWLFLIFAVVTSALTISLLVVAIFRSSLLTPENMSKIMPSITYYSSDEIVSLIDINGTAKVVTGVVAYGFATSITYVLLYLITNKFIKLFKLISKKKMFEDKGVKLINDALPLAVLVTFTQPVILFVTMFATNLFKYEDFNISGIIILFAVYILKLIITNGNELLKTKEEYATELSKSKSEVSDIKIANIKKEAKIREEKSRNKRSKSKKTIKR